MRSNLPGFMIECTEAVQALTALDLRQLSDTELMTLVSELAAAEQELRALHDRLLAMALARGHGPRRLAAA
jgi:hypothetical protein